MDELILNNPITEEQWDIITDVDFDHTGKVTFFTKHHKEVEFVKVVRCKDCKHRGTYRCTSYEAYFELGDDGYCSFGERKDEAEE